MAFFDETISRIKLRRQIRDIETLNYTEGVSARVDLTSKITTVSFDYPYTDGNQADSRLNKFRQYVVTRSLRNQQEYYGVTGKHYVPVNLVAKSLNFVEMGFVYQQDILSCDVIYLPPNSGSLRPIKNRVRLLLPAVGGIDIEVGTDFLDSMKMRGRHVSK